MSDDEKIDSSFFLDEQEERLSLGCYVRLIGDDLSSRLVTGWENGVFVAVYLCNDIDCYSETEIRDNCCGYLN